MCNSAHKLGITNHNLLTEVKDDCHNYWGDREKIVLLSKYLTVTRKPKFEDFEVS